MKDFFLKVKNRLQGLSFRSGLIVLALAGICYVISFAQALLPISVAWKGSLWVAFFGLAKAFQYSGLLIIGKEGVKKLKNRLKIRKESLT